MACASTPRGVSQRGQVDLTRQISRLAPRARAELLISVIRLNCTRRQFFDAMAAENVNCQVHYIPVYYHPYYQQLGYPKGLCPNAERLYERILSIPLYPDLTDADAESVVRAIQKIVAYYRK